MSYDYRPIGYIYSHILGLFYFFFTSSITNVVKMQEVEGGEWQRRWTGQSDHIPRCVAGRMWTVQLSFMSLKLEQSASRVFNPDL